MASDWSRDVQQEKAETSDLEVSRFLVLTDKLETRSQDHGLNYLAWDAGHPGLYQEWRC